MTAAQQHKILILDFGSQYTQLIARAIRALGVYCELHPFDVDDDFIRSYQAQAIVLSGGPESVTKQGSPRVSNANHGRATGWSGGGGGSQ
jgi:GMP synthase (glutamine-hydrolysing)